MTSPAAQAVERERFEAIVATLRVKRNDYPTERTPRGGYYSVSTDAMWKFFQAHERFMARAESRTAEQGAVGRTTAIVNAAEDWFELHGKRDRRATRQALVRLNRAVAAEPDEYVAPAPPTTSADQGADVLPRYLFGLAGMKEDAAGAWTPYPLASIAIGNAVAAATRAAFEKAAQACERNSIFDDPMYARRIRALADALPAEAPDEGRETSAWRKGEMRAFTLACNAADATVLKGDPQYEVIWRQAMLFALAASPEAAQPAASEVVRDAEERLSEIEILATRAADAASDARSEREFRKIAVRARHI